MLDEYRLPIVNISQYYPRKGTPGAKMPRIDRSIVKSRSKEVTELFKSYEPYTYWLGKEEKIYISNEMEGGDQVGHTKNYIKVW